MPVIPARPEGIPHPVTSAPARAIDDRSGEGTSAVLVCPGVCADATPAEPPALAPGLVAFLADMRAAVTTYVGRRRGEGTPVERVLPEVKILVRGAVCGAEMRGVAEVLVAHAVRWSIDAYHTSGKASHAALPNARSGAGRVSPPS